MSSDLQVVIGAGSGMGAAVATLLASSGPLLLADRNPAALATIASELHSADVTTMTVDIADARAVHDLADAAGGGFRSLVITAGLTGAMAAWQEVMSVNLVGTARVLEAFGPLATPGSVAVCFASVAGHLTPLPPEVLPVIDAPLAPGFLERLADAAPAVMELGGSSGGSYGVSKAGVLRLAKRTAVTWAEKGARVVSISPGVIDTPMVSTAMTQHPAVIAMLDHTPLRRPGRAAEVAEVVQFLCSPGASYVTGCDVIVDGGFLGATSTSTQASSL